MPFGLCKEHDTFMRPINDILCPSDGGEHLTSYAGVRDSEKSPVVGQSQEMWVFSIIFGVFWVSDRWRGAQYRSHKDGCHHEMAISYKCH